MATRYELTIHAEELCQRISLTTAELHEIVAHGIVEPDDAAGGEWLFAPQLVSVIARAARLHRDLHIDWPGVALAIELLETTASLRRENALLRQRLERYEAPRQA